MPPVSVPEESLDSASNEPTPAPSKPSGTIGIIYPPPEVRNIVDKTASFVARNGPEFEVRIRANEQNNTKFNFLNPGDPYNAYYQHKVTDFREMIAEGKVPQIEAQITNVPLSLPKVKQVTEIAPKDPPPATEFIADPPSISALDLDVVKLTAQFVARNGRNFLTNLMNREQRNYQFDFSETPAQFIQLFHQTCGTIY